MGEGIVRKLEMDMDGRTALFKMDNQPSPTTKHEGLCSVSRGSLDGRGVWGRVDMCACLAESLQCPPETITSLLISCSPVQNVFVV